MTMTDTNTDTNISKSTTNKKILAEPVGQRNRRTSAAWIAVVNADQPMERLGEGRLTGLPRDVWAAKSLCSMCSATTLPSFSIGTVRPLQPVSPWRTLVEQV